MRLKRLIWVGSSREDLFEFPGVVRRSMGFGLYLAQIGERPVHSKILKGFGGAGVIELFENDKTGTFRVIYTVEVSNVIFVLHAFQKKSKQGIKTPKPEIDLIKKRLKDAKEIYKELRYEKEI